MRPTSHGNAVIALCALSLAVSVVCCGCARLGTALQFRTSLEDRPSAKDILACLGSNDSAMKNLRATGTFRIRSPELGERQFRGWLVYRRPADLYIRGNHRLGTRLFEMTCAGERWVIDLPTENRQIRHTDGASFGNVPFNVSPLDIAKEMFFQEDWGGLDPEAVRLVKYNRRRQIAHIEIEKEHGLRREVEVRGNPWVVVRSKLYDRNDRLLVDTTRSEYREVEGIRLSASIKSVFPGNDAQMQFTLRKIRLNVPDLNDSLFAIEQSDDDTGTSN